MAKVGAFMEVDAQPTLESLGEKRVRQLLVNGMLVSHLMQPAYDWLDELDAAREPEQGR